MTLRTIAFKLLNTQADKDIIRKEQHDYNVTLRKVYNNMDLTQDPSFLESLRIKSAKIREYIFKEAETWHKKDAENKADVLIKIERLETKEHLYPKEFKHLQALKKSYKSKMVFGSRKQLQNRTKDLITHEEWVESRLHPMSFTGETSRYGNRCFDFEGLKNGQILYKPEASDVRVMLQFDPRKHENVLPILEDLALNKEISLTVKLTHDTLYITYDETILNGSNFDRKKIARSAPKPKGSSAYKEYWQNEFAKHDAMMKEDKLERILCIDSNPNEIGYCVRDFNGKIIETAFIEIGRDVSEGRRAHDIGLAIKYIVDRAIHFKCAYFGIEDLDSLETKDNGNRVSNKKINLEWKRALMERLIVRRCNESKIILRKINPYMSSFVGNLMNPNKYYDCVAAAVELSRRAVNMYIKGSKFLPAYDPNNITTDQMDFDIDLASFSTWEGLHRAIRDKSYRSKVKPTLSSKLFSRNSNIWLYFC